MSSWAGWNGFVDQIWPKGCGLETLGVINVINLIEFSQMKFYRPMGYQFPFIVFYSPTSWFKIE